MDDSTRAREAARIIDENQRRARQIPNDRYQLAGPAILFMIHERVRALVDCLRAESLLPLSGRTFLEVGCGTGGWLHEFESLGVKRENMAAVELDPARAAVAQAIFTAQRDEVGRVLCAGADIRTGDASSLPWKDESFDLVLQSTMFTSILSQEMRRVVASEMLRVVKSDGAILWYDFFCNNPWNPQVRGVSAREILSLFPGREVRLRRITLAPPIARRLVPLSWTAAHLVEKVRVLNTHFLGVIRVRVDPLLHDGLCA
jgi:ubiquinone/menaquinone biosynthesis C-methylase UbiE